MGAQEGDKKVQTFEQRLVVACGSLGQHRDPFIPDDFRDLGRVSIMLRRLVSATYIWLQFGGNSGRWRLSWRQVLNGLMS